MGSKKALVLPCLIAHATTPAGLQLLTASKNNCNRIWDIRTGRVLPQRFKGHQNTCKNFIRCGFGPSDALIVGGSEDGMGYLWDKESGQVQQVLRGHQGVVYDLAWNDKQALLASCSDDGTVRTWWWNQSMLR